MSARDTEVQIVEIKAIDPTKKPQKRPHQWRKGFQWTVSTFYVLADGEEILHTSRHDRLKDAVAFRDSLPHVPRGLSATFDETGRYTGTMWRVDTLDFLAALGAA